MSLDQFCLPISLFIASSAIEKYRLTRASLDSLDIIIGDVILDPVPVSVAVALRLDVAMKLLGHSAVAEEARGQCHLQSDPVLAHSNVEDVACVCRASCYLLDPIPELEEQETDPGALR